MEVNWKRLLKSIKSFLDVKKWIKKRIKKWITRGSLMIEEGGLTRISSGRRDDEKKTLEIKWLGVGKTLVKICG